MPLLDIPPFVLADESPPAWGPERRAFPCASYEMLEPIAFPRDLFAGALAEHARLLELHLQEILDAPLDHPGKPGDERFVEMDRLDLYTTILVADGGAHEVHKWQTMSASYVVQRCRGIVRQLMEEPAAGFTYVVVVAAGAASLHLLRCVPPARVGERPRLEVAERDVVVEPWDQWHRRDEAHVITWWRTPGGDEVASRVPLRGLFRTAASIAEALLDIRGPSLRKRLEAFSREEPRALRAAVVVTGSRGDEIHVCDPRKHDFWLAAFPGLAAAVCSRRAGFDAVIVYSYHWAVLCWLPVDPRSDARVPEPLVEGRTPQVDDDVFDNDGEPDEPDDEHMESQLSGLAPWAPAASEVHRAWKLGLAFAGFCLAFLWGLWQLIVGPGWVGRVGGILEMGIAASGGLLFGAVLSWQIEALEPVGRERRWRADKKRRDELEMAHHPPKPGPPVRGRKYWMRRLARHLIRLEQMVDTRGPEPIVADLRKLARGDIANLERADAHAVLAAWPRAARLLDADSERPAARTGARDRPN